MKLIGTKKILKKFNQNGKKQVIYQTKYSLVEKTQALKVKYIPRENHYKTINIKEN